MSTIVFTLNNSGIHHDYSNASFGFAEVLMENANSWLKRELLKLNLFSAKDFSLLQDRISDESNKAVPMNVKHVIIFYTVIDITCKALLQGVDADYFKEALGEDDAGFTEIRTKFLQFGQVALAKLEKENLKFPEFNKAVKLIKARQIEWS